jgi:hexosaminidase
MANEKRLVVVLCMLTGICIAQRDISIVPRPVQLARQAGEFTLNADTTLYASEEARAVADQLIQWLAPAAGFKLSVKPDSSDAAKGIVLRLDRSLLQLQSEGYRLVVTPDRAVLTAAAPAGLFYGCQTLRQLLPPDIFCSTRAAGVEWTIPCVTIEDTPRFGWRGLMLDTGRHFMPKEFIFKFIDLLALHKMNTFHWHLTEDQGWRIEIKKYPRLTEIGAWRTETLVGSAGRQPWTFDGTPHGGFYSQNDIREIVAYAQQRFITIVPEIEMPGHSQAALAAYPELGNTGKTLPVLTYWGVNENVFNVEESTILFLQDVLTEVLELFPSKFIHIGGDEAPKTQWKNSPKAQARMKELGLADEHELQSWFIRRMDTFLAERGRRLIGWDEILEGGLAPGATVMSWRGEGGGIAAARAGHDFVMASNSHLYLDYYQGDAKTEPLAIGGFLPLERVYAYDPVPESLTEAERKHVLGVQAQIWAEYIATPQKAEYMAYPRACAVSEVAWTPVTQKEFGNFRTRLEVHLKRLSCLNVNYRPLDPPKIQVGQWASGQTTETFAPMQWDVTPYLDGPGLYTVTFSYTAGAHRLDIRNARLLCGDKVIAEDAHAGTTGGSNRDNHYTLVVSEADFQKGAAYQLKAVVRSDGGSDSNGTVYLSKK